MPAIESIRAGIFPSLKTFRDYVGYISLDASCNLQADLLQWPVSRNAQHSLIGIYASHSQLIRQRSKPDSVKCVCCFRAKRKNKE